MTDAPPAAGFRASAAAALRSLTVQRLTLFLFIAILLEMTLFNFTHYEALFFPSVGTPPPVLSAAWARQDDGSFKIDTSQGDATITLSGINGLVKNLYIDIDPSDGTFINGAADTSVDSHVVTLKISVTDEANVRPLDLQDVRITDEVEDTHYIRLHLSGKTDTLVIKLASSLGRSIRIGTIAVNAVPPFQFSIARLLVVFALLALGYVIRPRSSLHKIRLERGNTRQTAAIILTVAVLALYLVMLAAANPTYNGLVANDYRNQYEVFSEMLAKGQLYFDYEVDPKLLELPNPYDPGARAAAGVRHLWDTAYFEGKYYMYFGIVPEIIFFLPFRLITGQSLPTHISVMICLLAMSAGFALLIHRAVRRWFPSAGLMDYLMVVLAGLASFGMLFAKFPTLYVVPIATATALGIWGMAFWLGALRDDRLNVISLLAGSLCIALVFGCRPQAGLVFLAAVPLFWDEVFHRRRLFSLRGFGATVCLLLPFLIVAAGLMLYNAARFGSPFDFGAAYNLTTNDMTRRGFVLARIPTGLFAFFVQLPIIYPQFPYFMPVGFWSTYIGLSIREVTFGGVLLTYPLLLPAAAFIRLRRPLRRKGLFGLVTVLLAVALVIAIMDIEVAGIVQRYIGDFLWLLFLAAALVLLTARERVSSPAGQLWLRRGVVLAFACTMCYALFYFFTVEPSSLSAEYSMAPLYNRIASLFDFYR